MVMPTIKLPNAANMNATYRDSGIEHRRLV